MREDGQRTVEMSPEEKFEAISQLRNTLEENFITLGELLSEVKRSKAYRMKGYKEFKEFVETEFSMASSLASKLIGIHDLYISELDLDEKSVKEIGMDRLSMIRPLIAKSTYDVKENWLQQAETLTTPELREKIKEVKDSEKAKQKTLKEVYTEQYIERMLAYFNCSQKELNFRLALYFQDADLENVRKIIKEKQVRFEEDTRDTLEGNTK